MPIRETRDDRAFPDILGLRKADILSDLEHMMAGTLPPGVEGIPSRLPSPRNSTGSIQSSRDGSPGYHEPEFPESYVRGRSLREDERAIPRQESLLKERPLEYVGDGAVGLLDAFLPGYAPWRDEAFLRRCLEGLPHPLDDVEFVREFVKPMFDELHQQSTEKDDGIIPENEELALSIIDTVASVDREFAEVEKWINGQCNGNIFSDKTRPVLEVSFELTATFHGSEHAMATQVDTGKGKKKAAIGTKAPGEPPRPTDFSRLRKAWAEVQRAYNETLPWVIMRDPSKQPCPHLRYRRALALARAEKRLEELATEVMAAPLPKVDCTPSSTWLQQGSPDTTRLVQVEALS